jgi:hypothetical protein
MKTNVAKKSLSLAKPHVLYNTWDCSTEESKAAISVRGQTCGDISAHSVISGALQNGCSLRYRISFSGTIVKDWTTWLTASGSECFFEPYFQNFTSSDTDLSPVVYDTQVLCSGTALSSWSTEMRLADDCSDCTTSAGDWSRKFSPLMILFAMIATVSAVSI